MGKTFLILLALISTAGLGARDWPKWLGPFENGKTDEVIPSDISLREVEWTANVGIGFSSFAIGGGKVFTMGYAEGRETVWCLSESDGKVIWRFSYDAELMPNLHEGGPNATPTIDRDRVYTMSKDGQLHALSIRDGSVLWKKNMPVEAEMYRPPEWGFGGSPYLFRDRVIIEAGATFAYRRTDGKEVWRSEKYRPAYGTPQWFGIPGGGFLATLKTDGLVLLDPENGETLGFSQWRTSFQTNANTPLDAGQGRIFISTGYDRGCALFRFDGGTLTKLYEEQTMCNHMGNSVLIGDHLYGFDGTAHRGRPVALTCIELETGTKRWSTTDYRYGSVIAAGKDLIVLTETGELMVGRASPNGFSPRAQHRILEGRCWTPPAMANGRIYVRNAAGRVVVVPMDGKER